MFFSKNDYFDYDKEYLKVMNKIYNLGYYFFKNEEDAQDLLQEVYLIGQKKHKTLMEKNFFSTWIYRIAQNKAIDWIKKKSKETFIDEKIEIAEKEQQEDIYFTEQDIEGLKKQLVNLPDKYRIPLILFYMEKKSYDEISHLLNIKMENLKVTLYRAKKLLKQRLENIQEQL